MDTEKKEDIKPGSPSEPNKPAPAGEQDPLKTELEKVQTTKRTKLEKLQYTKKRVDEQLKELGVEVEEPEANDDDKPLTKGEFKRLQEQAAVKTALELAEEIPNSTERELVKYHLENTIRSTGNPKQDLDLARSIVNDIKNRQILEEQNRKPEVKQQPSGGGAPAKPNKQEEFTSEELMYMRPPFNLTKEQILAARPK